MPCIRSLALCGRRGRHAPGLALALLLLPPGDVTHDLAASFKDTRYFKNESSRIINLVSVLRAFTFSNLFLDFEKIHIEKMFKLNGMFKLNRC